MQAIKARKAADFQHDTLAYFKDLPLFTNLPSEDLNKFSNATSISQYKKEHFSLSRMKKRNSFTSSSMDGSGCFTRPMRVKK